MIRRCSGCQCLVKRSHNDDMCGWPCSPFGFVDLLGGRVQSRRKWLSRTLPPYERTDDALRAGLMFAETLPSRSLAPRRLPRDEPHPRPSLPHHAALAGEVVGEVARAERKHGRAMPGGWGATGGDFANAEAIRAKVRCDFARDAGCASWDLVLAEEVAEVFAERGGSLLQRAELVQVAAVCLRWIEAIDSVRCAVGFMVWLRGVTAGEAVSNG